MILLFSCSVMSDSLWPHGLQNIRLPCPSPSPEVCSNSIESVIPPNHCALCHPLLRLPSVFPSVRVFSNGSVLHIRCQSIGALLSASVLPVNIQSWLVWSSFCPRESQESSSTTQFKIITFLALSLLYGPTLSYSIYKTHLFYLFLCSWTLRWLLWPDYWK